MSSISLLSLPSELILHALDLLPSTELLPLTLVSHRIHALITRLLHVRLMHAASFSHHQLIFECYHPSQKLTEPPLHGIFTGTSPKLDSCVDYEDECAIGKLHALNNLYCAFQLQRQERATRVRQVPGDIPGSRTYTGPSQGASIGQDELRIEEAEPVKQTLSLEGHELFIQLVAVTSLVQFWPGVAHLRSFIEVQDCVVRVWREWLGERAKGESGMEQSEGNASASGKGKAAVNTTDSMIAARATDVGGDERILWMDAAKNVGLKLRVKEKRWRKNMPVLMYMDEEISVSYEVVYEQLFVRTSHILFVLEDIARENETNSGKAVVFGSFR